MQLKNIALSLLVLLLMPVESVFAQADLKAQQENWIKFAELLCMFDRSPVRFAHSLQYMLFDCI